MGQAAVSPDTLDESTTSIASADDLLSQLAGEEIDRLLAESEAERAAAEPQRVAAQIAPGADAPAPVVPLPPETPAVKADVEPPATRVPLASVPNVVPESLAATRIAHDATAPAAAATERAVLNEAPTSVAEVLDRIDHAPIATEAADTVPPYLKPLVWLNAPLASCPEWLRELLGKAAIVTLVNAVAVLAYVLIFRKH